MDRRPGGHGVRVAGGRRRTGTAPGGAGVRPGALVVTLGDEAIRIRRRRVGRILWLLPGGPARLPGLALSDRVAARTGPWSATIRPPWRAWWTWTRCGTSSVASSTRRPTTASAPSRTASSPGWSAVSGARGTAALEREVNLAWVREQLLACSPPGSGSWRRSDLRLFR